MSKISRGSCVWEPQHWAKFKKSLQPHYIEIWGLYQFAWTWQFHDANLQIAPGGNLHS